MKGWTHVIIQNLQRLKPIKPMVTLKICILCEDLFRYVAKEVVGNLQLPWGEVVIDVEKPFRRAHMVELIKEKKTGVDFFPKNVF